MDVVDCGYKIKTKRLGTCQAFLLNPNSKFAAFHKPVGVSYETACQYLRRSFVFVIDIKCNGQQQYQSFDSLLPVNP